jgi:hypothetical protein
MLLVLSISHQAIAERTATFADSDGNGIDDGSEVLLAEKFRPVLMLPMEDMGMRPSPVGILGDGGDLTADKLWARVYNAAGQVVTVVRTTHPDWSPSPSFASPSFNYSAFGWDGSAIPYVGRPPGAAYSVYYVRLYLDYGGPSADCPSEWEALYEEGDGFHPPGDDLPAVAYAHLFLEAGDPIIQYWFFFPCNDWVNNHEGDWEHVHFRVSSVDPEEAVLAGAAFYFHDLVLERPPGSLVVADDTHPIVWVGGTGVWSCGACDDNDCAGDGSTGPGSHGCYPSHGTWTDVGAEVPGCGRADDVVARCGRYLHWNDLSVEILPDPDAIDYAERPGLSWHRAEIPFGTPFVPSFCDDACEFFDDFPPTSWLIETCGNAAPRGPAHHQTWGSFSGGAPQGTYSLPPPVPDGPGVLRVPFGFAEIGEAAACALPGDTILVWPGTYSELARLPGRVTVLSDYGAELTTWRSPPWSRAVRVRTGALGARIGDVGRGFTFTNQPGIGFPHEHVYLGTAGENILRGNRFVGYVMSQAIRVPEASGGGSSSTRIESNRFSASARSVFVLFGPTQEVVVGGSRAAANDFLEASGVRALVVSCGECGEVKAEHNYWGSLDADTIAFKIDAPSGTVDFDPWTDSTHAGEYGVCTGIGGREEETDFLRVDETDGNPTEGEIRLAIRLPREGKLRIRVYDVVGRVVLEPWDGPIGAGEHAITFSVRTLASGVYFAKADYEGRSSIRKVVVVR